MSRYPGLMLYQERKEAGLCTQCGKPREGRSTSLCNRHFARAKFLQDRWRQAFVAVHGHTPQRASQIRHAQHGRCIQCGGRLEHYALRCDACYLEHLERQRKRLGTVKRNITYFTGRKQHKKTPAE